LSLVLDVPAKAACQVCCITASMVATYQHVSPRCSRQIPVSVDCSSVLLNCSLPCCRADPYDAELMSEEVHVHLQLAPSQPNRFSLCLTYLFCLTLQTPITLS
jgi:hypothetical protein